MKRSVWMDPRRFQTLADAYGADLARWPPVEQEAARSRAVDGACQRLLAEASALDDALDQWRAPDPSPDLRQRLIAAAPSARSASARRGVGFWLSGAGLAAAGLAGVLCGAAASSVALANARDEALVASATADALGSLSKLPDQGARADGQIGRVGRPL